MHNRIWTLLAISFWIGFFLAIIGLAIGLNGDFSSLRVVKYFFVGFVAMLTLMIDSKNGSQPSLKAILLSVASVFILNLVFEVVIIPG